MKCPDCGVEVPGGAGFCHECGTELPGAAAPASTATEPAVKQTSESYLRTTQLCPVLDRPGTGATQVAVVESGAALRVLSRDWTHVDGRDYLKVAYEGRPVYIDRGYTVQADPLSVWTSRLARRAVTGHHGATAAASSGQKPGAEGGDGSPRRTVATAAASSGQKPYILYTICNGLLILSTLLPWERLAFINASGLDVGRGWLVFFAALGAGGVAVWSMTREQPVPGLRVAQFVSAGVGMGMALLEVAIIASACSDDELFCVRPGLGIGAILALVFGLALGAVALFVKPPTSVPEQQEELTARGSGPGR